MLEKLGNKNMALLGKMMSMHAEKHRVIASNIANVNTPNYRRQEFRFETALQQALENGTAADYKAVRGYIAKPNTTPVRNNGNNVDIDSEMLDLGGNSAAYEMYGQIYNKKAEMLKYAIRGGR